MNVFDFQKKKAAHEKITMVTCYDFFSAKIIEQTHVDCVLVGDSLAMVMHGYPNTTNATPDMMIMHTQAVARGIKSKFIITDLPFMSYRKSLNSVVNVVEKIIQSGAHAIKLEGATGNLNIIKHIVESGVPVMGHLGLTPQHIHSLGGFKVQGKDSLAKQRLLEEAKLLEAAGCFSLVLECIPADLTEKITQSISIPTIGIGAGPQTDGQVLVLHDLLGLQTAFKTKFLKHYLQGEELFVNSINSFVAEVKAVQYPNQVEHAY